MRNWPVSHTQYSRHLDLGAIIAFIVATGERSWPGHLWIEREDGRIIRQLVVEDSGEIRPAPAEHPPLGELRSGHGQFAAGSRATLPPGSPDEAQPPADRLHGAWNGRALDQFTSGRFAQLLTLALDGACYFERALVHPEGYAVAPRLSKSMCGDSC